MYCEDCGFPIDELNGSQPVCPRCGGLPTDIDLNPTNMRIPGHADQHSGGMMIRIPK